MSPSCEASEQMHQAAQLLQEHICLQIKWLDKHVRHTEEEESWSLSLSSGEEHLDLHHMIDRTCLRNIIEHDNQPSHH